MWFCETFVSPCRIIARKRLQIVQVPITLYSDAHHQNIHKQILELLGKCSFQHNQLFFYKLPIVIMAWEGSWWCEVHPQCPGGAWHYGKWCKKANSVKIAFGAKMSNAWEWHMAQYLNNSLLDLDFWWKKWTDNACRVACWIGGRRQNHNRLQSAMLPTTDGHQQFFCSSRVLYFLLSNILVTMDQYQYMQYVKLKKCVII